MADAELLRKFGFERHQRLAGIALRPPLALDQLGAGAAPRRRRSSPRSPLSTHCASGGALISSTFLSFKRTSRPRSIGASTSLAAGASRSTACSKSRILGFRNVEHEVVGRFLGQAASSVRRPATHRPAPRPRASDKPGAERQHHRTRQATGRAEIADGDGKLRPPRPRHPPREPCDSLAEPEKHGEHGDQDRGRNRARSAWPPRSVSQARPAAPPPRTSAR